MMLANNKGFYGEKKQKLIRHELPSYFSYVVGIYN